MRPYRAKHEGTEALRYVNSSCVMLRTSIGVMLSTPAGAVLAQEGATSTTICTGESVEAPASDLLKPYAGAGELVTLSGRSMASGTPCQTPL